MAKRIIECGEDDVATLEEADASLDEGRNRQSTGAALQACISRQKVRSSICLNGYMLWPKLDTMSIGSNPESHSS